MALSTASAEPGNAGAVRCRTAIARGGRQRAGLRASWRYRGGFRGPFRRTDSRPGRWFSHSFSRRGPRAERFKWRRTVISTPRSSTTARESSSSHLGRSRHHAPQLGARLALPDAIRERHDRRRGQDVQRAARRMDDRSLFVVERMGESPTSHGPSRSCRRTRPTRRWRRRSGRRASRADSVTHRRP